MYAEQLQDKVDRHLRRRERLCSPRGDHHGQRWSPRTSPHPSSSLPGPSRGPIQAAQAAPTAIPTCEHVPLPLSSMVGPPLADYRPPQPRQNHALSATDHHTSTSTSTPNVQPHPEFVQGSSRSAVPPTAPAPDAMETDDHPSATLSITDLPVPPPMSDLPSINTLDCFLDGDNEDEDDEIDLNEVRQLKNQARAHCAHATVNRTAPTMMGTRTQIELRAIALPYGDTPVPSLPQGVPASATHNQWPINMPWPVMTEICLADAWHDYVLRSANQASALMRSARDQQGGAVRIYGSTQTRCHQEQLAQPHVMFHRVHYLSIGP